MKPENVASSIVPPCGDAVHEFGSGQPLHANQHLQNPFIDYCQWHECQRSLPRQTRRRKYCSDTCGRKAHRAKSVAWKLRFREENGEWPHPSENYYSVKQRRHKVKEATARWRVRRQQIVNDKATEVLKFWSDPFPNRTLEHCVFPSERYGAGGDKFEPTVYGLDPTKPINSFKESWESAKDAAGVKVRFHDLRHTVVTRMLEAGVPLSVVAAILGWSPATTVRMAKRYGHIGQVAQRQAVEALEPKKKHRNKSKMKKSSGGGHKNGHSRTTDQTSSPVSD